MPMLPIPKAKKKYNIEVAAYNNINLQQIFPRQLVRVNLKCFEAHRNVMLIECLVI